jgi:hypothetical protein
MHFDLTITLGQLLTFLGIVGVGWGLSQRLSLYQIEHEMLMQKYCEDAGIQIDTLPTRHRGRR